MLALVLPSVASAQATRTWVSGVGDDANPCSRTAPCKTFAGAISKTAAGGIIMPMDDGGFGTLTITKPITVDGGHHSAGVLSSGGINGMNINIDPAVQPANFVNNGRVVLKNLKFEGNTSIPTAGGFTPGLNGIRITNAKNVKIINSDIGFYSRSGVDLESGVNPSSVLIQDSVIHDNGGAGALVASRPGIPAKITIRNSTFDDNTCGAVSASFQVVNNIFTSDCGTTNTTPGSFATLDIFDSSFSDNTNRAVQVRGSQAFARLSGNRITGSNTALQSLDSGTILSWQNNSIGGNNVANVGPGTTVGTLTPLLRPVHGR
jgi:hypothetical protein